MDDDDEDATLVEIANPNAMPTPMPIPTLKPRLGTKPETLFHTLVLVYPLDLEQQSASTAAVRVASINSCLWRIIFVKWPLNDGDIETLDDVGAGDDDMFILLLLLMINNDKW